MLGRLSGGPLRREFGVRGVLLGAPGLIWRTREVLLVALVVCLPVSMLLAFATRDSPPLEVVRQATSQFLSQMLSESLPADAAFLELLDDLRDAASIVGTSLVEYALLAWVAAVVVVAAAYACVGRPVGIRSVCGLALRRSGRLAVLVLIGFGLAHASLGFQLAALAMTSMAGGSVGLVLVGLVLGVLATASLFLAKVMIFFAVPGIVIEGARPLSAVARTLGLALRRSFPAFGTAFVGWVLLMLTDAGADWLFGPSVLGAVWPIPDWVARGASHAVSYAVGVPIVAVLFMLRYLDLRLRREPLDREQLQYELHQAVSPQPRAR